MGGCNNTKNTIHAEHIIIEQIFYKYPHYNVHFCKYVEKYEFIVIRWSITASIIREVMGGNRDSGAGKPEQPAVGIQWTFVTSEYQLGVYISRINSFYCQSLFIMVVEDENREL